MDLEEKYINAPDVIGMVTQQGIIIALIAVAVWLSNRKVRKYMQKVIIDVLNLSNTQNITNGSLASALIVKAYKNGIFIHKNMTNGEVIQSLFPNIDKGFSNVIDLNLWWNAKYKAEKEANNVR